jgi:GDP-L-fucose synthase
LFKISNINVFSPPKNILNLTNVSSIKKTIEEFNPDAIIHTAIVGGKRSISDSMEDVVTNVQMFDNLMACVYESVPVFIFGSGAEYDRREDIDYVNEDLINYRYPTDPYGLSKNIISRKALSLYRCTYVLRLFGCFNYDEDSTRFIKNCISSINQDLPIIIHQNRLMDFFYLNDVYKVIEHCLYNGGPRHINLVYPYKNSLLDIANYVLKITEFTDYPIIIQNKEEGKKYTGNGEILSSLGLNLTGLFGGIGETVDKLL